MNNLIAAMNHPGSAENEYIMKGKSLIPCKKKKWAINKHLKIKLNSVDEFFFKLDLFLTLFHVLIFFVKEIQNKSIECVFNKFWGGGFSGHVS